MVFGYCEGFIPVRGFVDKGQGFDGKPHNIWIAADGTVTDKMATFATWASREGAAVYVIPGTVAETGQAKAADVRQMQTIVVDLDAGDIGAKLDHLVEHLGDPTLVVESGGRTPEGVTKLHVWWKLNEAAEGEDLATLCRLRGDIAVKVGGDTHFRSAHQPIRVAGSVYHKGGFQRLVAIRHHRAQVEVDLGEFAEAVQAMPASLIGRSRSSAFRLTTTTVSMSLTGSRFSSESARSCLHHRIRRRGGTIYAAALPERSGPSELTNSPHPSSREGHHSTVGGTRSFSYRI